MMSSVRTDTPGSVIISATQRYCHLIAGLR